MKTVLLLLLLPCFVHAQQHQWEKLNIDSSTFANLYGSEKEFAVESSDQLSSSHRWRVFFVGYKWGYTANLTGYLQERHWDIIQSTTDNSITYNCKMYNNEKGYNANLKITFLLDDDERITKASVTGTPDDVIDLYLSYWEHLDISLNNLKPKHSVFFNSVGDKVSFAWTSINPEITVSKSNIAHYDVGSN